ncbi:MAG: peptidylprolyl isomerase [Kiritimatiellae bacterium]|nr:peptidylprolyl isomerase [Kiritimatiellia bacterium]
MQVNEHELNHETLDRDVTIRIEGKMKQEAPHLSTEELRRRAVMIVVDQFVKRSLLLDESDKSGVRITPEEERAAFERIRGQVEQEGKTLEEVMEGSPLGPEHMRNEVRVGLRISKFLSSRMPRLDQITSDEVEQYREKFADRLKTPERVGASHILISTNDQDTPKALTEKRSKTEAILQDLKNGAAFDALAKEHSSCPSRLRGGDLGTFPRGQMVKPFEDAAFNQPVGEIGPIVQTRFGYHIIRVNDKFPGGPVPDNQVRQQMAKQTHQEHLVALLKELKSQATVYYSKDVVAAMQSNIDPLNLNDR